MLSITRLCSPLIDAAVKQTLLRLFIFEKNTMLAPGLAPSFAWNASLTNYLWRWLQNASLSDSSRLVSHRMIDALSYSLFTLAVRRPSPSQRWSSKLDSEQRRILMQRVLPPVIPRFAQYPRSNVEYAGITLTWWDVWVKHLIGIKKRAVDWTRGLHAESCVTPVAWSSHPDFMVDTNVCQVATPKMSNMRTAAK